MGGWTMRYRVLSVALLLAACGGGGGGNEGAAPPPVARFAFVANQVSRSSPVASGELSAFTVDASTGVLRHNGYAVVPTGLGLTAVAADPLNRFVYATNQSGVWAFKIDATHGTVSSVSGPFIDVSANPVFI